MAASAPAYPPIEPFNSGRLRVGSGIHEMCGGAVDSGVPGTALTQGLGGGAGWEFSYYEEVGCKGGKPAVFLHGGPGGGFGPTDRQYFDPAVYHVVLLDQRGAGKSTPSAHLEVRPPHALHTHTHRHTHTHTHTPCAYRIAPHASHHRRTRRGIWSRISKRSASMSGR
jgi:pimeloyl-ACP methyl ester carboxylesterase